MTLTITFLLSFAAAGLTVQQPASPTLHHVRVNGVTLHYTDHGTGPAVVLLHGGMEDYRAWDAQVAPLSKDLRVIAYSRRFNYPNHNAHSSPDHSALIDAEDLAALIHALNLGPVVIVGHSYGAYVALELAAKHPRLVRALVLSEPPLLGWLNELPGDKLLLDDFMNNMWVPAGNAFRNHDTDGALRVSVDWFGSHEFPAGGEKITYDSMPREMQDSLMQDIGEWEALTTSRDAFPAFPRDQARRIRVPVLLLSGNRSVEAFKMIAAELARTLPSPKFVVLPNATHEMWSEFPEECTKEILPFIKGQAPTIKGPVRK